MLRTISQTLTIISLRTSRTKVHRCASLNRIDLSPGRRRVEVGLPRTLQQAVTPGLHSLFFLCESKMAANAPQGRLDCCLSTLSEMYTMCLCNAIPK